MFLVVPAARDGGPAALAAMPAPASGSECDKSGLMKTRAKAWAPTCFPKGYTPSRFLMRPAKQGNWCSSQILCEHVGIPASRC